MFVAHCMIVDSLAAQEELSSLEDAIEEPRTSAASRNHER